MFQNGTLLITAIDALLKKCTRENKDDRLKRVCFDFFSPDVIRDWKTYQFDIRRVKDLMNLLPNIISNCVQKHQEKTNDFRSFWRREIQACIDRECRSVQKSKKKIQT